MTKSTKKSCGSNVKNDPNNSQTCSSPKRSFQPCTLPISFEFVIAILVDQGHFTKGMFGNPWGFTSVLFTKCRQCEMWVLGKRKGVAHGTVPARDPKNTL